MYGQLWSINDLVKIEIKIYQLVMHYNLVCTGRGFFLYFMMPVK